MNFSLITFVWGFFSEFLFGTTKFFFVDEEISLFSINYFRQFKDLAFPLLFYWFYIDEHFNGVLFIYLFKPKCFNFNQKYNFISFSIIKKIIVIYIQLTNKKNIKIIFNLIQSIILFQVFFAKFFCMNFRTNFCILVALEFILFLFSIYSISFLTFFPSNLSQTI